MEEISNYHKFQITLESPARKLLAWLLVCHHLSRDSLPLNTRSAAVPSESWRSSHISSQLQRKQMVSTNHSAVPQPQPFILSF